MDELTDRDAIAALVLLGGLQRGDIVDMGVVKDHQVHNPGTFVRAYETNNWCITRWRRPKEPHDL